MDTLAQVLLNKMLEVKQAMDKVLLNGHMDHNDYDDYMDAEADLARREPYKYDLYVNGVRRIAVLIPDEDGVLVEEPDYTEPFEGVEEG